MRYRTGRKNKVEKLFNKNKVVTIDDLKNVLDTKFSKTVFRYLQEMSYLSSYNNAGKFYTIPHIPQFDECGLWHYQVASFSKFGTLKSTLCSIIEGSQDGFTHRELKEQLRCRVQNTLNDLTKNNLISRGSVDGLFVYTSTNKKKAVVQISQRKKKVEIKINQEDGIELPIIIEILLELLRSSAWDAKDISKKLCARRVSATEQEVKEVLHRYDLKKNSWNHFDNTERDNTV